MSVTKKHIEVWIAAKANLDVVKAKEMELRKEICEAVLQGTHKGTEHLIVEGLDVAATGKINTKVDTECLDTIWNDLSQGEKDCIVYKPSLVAKEYKTVDAKSKLHEAIITTPGTPTLKVKPVKE